MPPHRDVDAFDERAPTYDGGFLGRLHHDIADRTSELALSGPCAPARILDVGCGTGYLLQSLARRCPEALELAGIDAAPSMIDTARAHAGDGPLVFATGVVEHLPYDDATFDLVVSTTSFDHWSDQRAGLAECARVMVRGARLVLVDQFSTLLAPTLLFGRKGKARTPRRASRLLAEAGFDDVRWHDLYASIIKAVTAST